jgi:pyruvate-ferredoxin/flavodoxin oxidoreductase
VIAYSHCIAHGYDLAFGPAQQKAAAAAWIWPLYRFDPRRAEASQPPLVLDSPAPTGSVADYMGNELRFRMVEKMDAARYRRFVAQAELAAARRWDLYRQLAGVSVPEPAPAPAPPEPVTSR